MSSIERLLKLISLSTALLDTFLNMGNILAPGSRPHDIVSNVLKYSSVCKCLPDNIKTIIYSLGYSGWTLSRLCSMVVKSAMANNKTGGVICIFLP